METRAKLEGVSPLLTVAGLVVIVAGLRAAESLLIPFLLALFLAIICSPALVWLQRRRVPTFLAVVLVMVGLLAVLAGVGALVGGSVNDFIDSIPSYQARIESLGQSWAALLERMNLHLPSLHAMDYFNPSGLMGLLGTGLKGLASTLSNTVMIILTMVFMLFEATVIPVKLQVAFGVQEKTGRQLRRVVNQVQRYLAIKTLVSLGTGGAIAAWTAILGVDFPLVWGLLAFLLNYIPNIGSIIAAVPAVLFALVQLGVGEALLVAIGYVVVNTVLGNIVEPNLMGRTLGLSTLVVFLSLVFWGWLWGPVGMLLSVPLTMIIKILLENSEDLRWVAVLLDSGRAAQLRLRDEEAGEPPSTG